MTTTAPHEVTTMPATAPPAPVQDAPPATLRFAAGLPGFGAARSFSMVPWGGEDSPFSLLECTDVDGLAFVVVPPALFFPDYEPEVDAHTVERLGIEVADDAELLVILTLGPTPADATANLLGPIVVDRRTGEAVQAVLAGQRWSSRTALVS